MVLKSLFSSKCPSCGKPVERGEAYCGSCGAPLSMGKITCSCGAENPANDSFCASCGRDLSASAAPEIQRHHWARRPEDFAVSVEATDIPGLLRRGLIVEPGTNAMLIERGVNRGVVPPGAYQLETPGQKLWNWISTGIPEQATVLLVDVTPSDLEFHLGGRFTKDPLPVGVTVRMQVEVCEPGKFLVNLLKGSKRLSKDDLREYLYPEVTAVADLWLRSQLLETLAEDPTQAEQLELALEQALKATFARVGLSFLKVRTVQLNLEPYDRIKGLRGNYAIWQMEERVKLEGDREKAQTEAERRQFEAQYELTRRQEEVDSKARYFELEKQVDFQALVRETHEIELEEQRAALFTRMQRALLNKKKEELNSEAELNRFMDEQDRQNLMMEKDRRELLRTWKEAGEDHDRQRAYLLAKLETEQTYERRAIQIKLQHGEDITKVQNEIEIASLRADHEAEMRRRTMEDELKLEDHRQAIQRKRDDLEHEQQKSKLELARLVDDQARAERRANTELALEISQRVKDIRYAEDKRRMELERLDEEERLRIKRVDELERRKAEHQLRLEQLEFDERRLQAERQHQREVAASQQNFELQRMELLAKLSPEALISVSGVEQARLLAEVRKNDVFKGMSDDQILAMAAATSPEAAKIWQERAKAQSGAESAQQAKELYERMLAREAELGRQAREDADKRVSDASQAWREASGQARQTTERAIDRTADVAQSFARSQNTPAQGPIIVTPGSSSETHVMRAGEEGPVGGGRPETKNCPECALSNAIDAHFCVHCGHEFKGV